MRFRTYCKANHAASMRMRDTIDVTSRRRHLVTQREQKGGKTKEEKKREKKEREDADVSKLLKQEGGNDHRGEVHVVCKTF